MRTWVKSLALPIAFLLHLALRFILAGNLTAEPDTQFKLEIIAETPAQEEMIEPTVAHWIKD